MGFLQLKSARYVSFREEVGELKPQIRGVDVWKFGGRSVGFARRVGEQFAVRYLVSKLLDEKD